VAGSLLRRPSIPDPGDGATVPRGYHPVGMPDGYDGDSLNVMAGPTRPWDFTLDPDHAWLMDWDTAGQR
jgi:5-deoxy-D-glucuronate isomerase